MSDGHEPESDPMCARGFAIDAHGDQKYGDHPYSYHLEQVASLCAPFGLMAETLAWLHDVAEDTDVPLEAIRAQFGDRVAEGVALLTDEPGVNRRERKARTNAKLAQATHATALIVKAADRLANLRMSAQGSDGSKLGMYRREHAAFREAVYRPALCDAFWDEMDQILGSTHGR
jgi:(p)ppGpp synthase/HD superfamily hydrolase